MEPEQITVTGKSTPTREALISETFIRLTDGLVDDFDVIELLDFLTERCADLLGIDEAGVVLVDRVGMLRLVSATSARMRMVELFEIQSEEGPCQDAYRTGRVSSVDDLVDDGAQWSRFAPQARDAGFGSAYGIPMRLRDQTIGAMNLFGNRPGALGARDQRLGQAFADAATICILQDRAGRDRNTLNDQLQGALDSRVVVEQAKGIISEQAGCSVDDAFDLIRRHARSRSVRLTEVARAIVASQLDAAAIGPTRRS